MRKELYSTYGNTVITMDPTNNHEISVEELMVTCGFLPGWVLAYNTTEDLTLKEHLDKQYRFGMCEMKGGKVTQSGEYHYPEDPPLFPLLYITLDHGAEFLQWQFGICAMRDSQKADWFVTRMD